MAEAGFRRGDGDRWYLSGDLDFNSVPGLVGALGDVAGTGETVEIDLQGVTRADSAGLALLVECLRVAERAQHGVRFVNVPLQLQSIARVSGLDQVLALPDSPAT